MRIITGRRFLFAGALLVWMGIQPLVWTIRSAVAFPEGDWVSQLASFLVIGPFALAMSLVAANRCRVFHIDETGIRGGGILWKKKTFRWEDIREIGVGLFKARQLGRLSEFGGIWIYIWEDIPVFYLSVRELTDQQRLCMNDNSLDDCWQFGVGVHYHIRHKAGDAIKAAIVKCCPGPKPPEFFPQGGKNGEKHFTYVLRKKNPDGEMEYSMHVVPKP